MLPAGLARRHSGNPAAALRVELLYALPVLLSGLAALVLGKPELEHWLVVNMGGLIVMGGSTAFAVASVLEAPPDTCAPSAIYSLHGAIANLFAFAMASFLAFAAAASSLYRNIPIYKKC